MTHHQTLVKRWDILCWYQSKYTFRLHWYDGNWTRNEHMANESFVTVNICAFWHLTFANRHQFLSYSNDTHSVWCKFPFVLHSLRPQSYLLQHIETLALNCLLLQSHLASLSLSQPQFASVFIIICWTFFWNVFHIFDERKKKKRAWRSNQFHQVKYFTSKISIECTVKVKAEESASAIQRTPLFCWANLYVAHCFQNRMKWWLIFRSNEILSHCAQCEDRRWRCDENRVEITFRAAVLLALTIE